MSSKRIPIDALASEIMNILNEYAEDIDNGLADTAELVGQQGARAINGTAKGIVRGNRRSKKGKYYNSWKVTSMRRRLYTDVVIHSGKPGLPHLLEFSHRTGKRGHYSGREHIAPVERELVKQFEDGVVKYIQKH